MSRGPIPRPRGKHTLQYGPEVDLSIKHWSLEDKLFHCAPEEGSTTTKPELRTFTAKTWVLLEDSQYKPVQDGDQEGRTSFTVRKLAEPEPAQENALTATDIYGAVGGETIAGITKDTFTPEAGNENSNSNTSDHEESNEPWSVETVEPAEDVEMEG